MAASGSASPRAGRGGREGADRRPQRGQERGVRPRPPPATSPPTSPTAQCRAAVAEAERLSAGSTSWSTTPAPTSASARRPGRGRLAQGDRHQPDQHAPDVQAAYPLLKRQGGKIINIGSMMSLFGVPFSPAYAASKGGVVQTRGARDCLGRRQHPGNAILPGWIDTARTRRGAALRRVLARVPAGRWGEPRDMAGSRVPGRASVDFITAPLRRRRVSALSALYPCPRPQWVRSRQQPSPASRVRKRGEIMPKRTDIPSILIIGAGPIVIGQACEFDYSGAQACKALRAEGYRVVLVNSNPATIMTDPGPGRRHLCRADHAGDRRENHRPREAGRAAADHGRPDRAQHGDDARRIRRARETRRRADRRQAPT